MRFLHVYLQQLLINWQLIDNLLVLLLPSFFKLFEAVDKITIQVSKIHGVVWSVSDLLEKYGKRLRLYSKYFKIK